MAVILTDAGAIKETIIKFDEDITQSQVDNLSFLFNNKLRGMPLDKIDEPFEQYMMNEMKGEVRVVKPIIEQINRAIVENTNLYLEGTNKVFDFPEFKKMDVARNFLNVLDFYIKLW